MIQYTEVERLQEYSTKLQDILKLSVFSNADIFANDGALSKSAMNITIMDTTSLIDWVNPGEIVIIGEFFAKIDHHYLERLLGKSICAIISKKKFKKNITQSMIQACYEQKVPIILVEDATSWTQLINPITDLFNQGKAIILNDTIKFYENIIFTLDKIENSANICQYLSQISNFSLCILNDQLEMTDSSADLDWPMLLEGIHKDQLNFKKLGYTIDDYSIDGYEYISETLNTMNRSVCLFPFYKNKVKYYLATLKTNKDSYLEPYQLAKINTFIFAIKYRSMLNSAIMRSNYLYRNLIFNEIVQSSNRKLLLNHARSLGLSPGLKYLIFYCESKDDIIHKDNVTDIINRINDHFESTSAFLIENSFIILTNSFSYQPIKELLNEHYLELDHFFVGVSSQYPLAELSSALDEAKIAYYYATFKKDQKSAFINYRDVALISLILDKDGHLNETLYRKLFNKYVHPLIVNDQDNKSKLLETIQTFIQENYSFKETSRHLFIHVNTLRARITRIESILNIDMNNSSDRMQLQIAITLYHLLHFIFS
ncbi:helix-turn-helix domain-containing protein [Facklamia hominis]|uniref:helix-turn-helix domain-containing protein n=1 Tax=Facklamia hominis TaxID=178214 RepID=UPI00288AB532|nr:helix-turn-helix domain-containing protein [Facklamia hominis]